MPRTSLSDKHAAFVAEYRSDRNAVRAYQAVYGTKNYRSAASASQKLLRNDRIRLEIAALDSKKAERLEVDSDQLLLQALLIVQADPRELVEHHVGCCRCCWGEGFQHQRTVGEFNRELEAWTNRGKSAESFDQKGGIGFNALLDPNPACPQCAGAGQGRTILRDTRTLSPAALALYAGVKQTKDGVQVLMHDKLVALEKLFKHTGLYAADNAQKTTPLGQALAGFVAALHSRAAGRIVPVPQANIRRIK